MLHRAAMLTPKTYELSTSVAHWNKPLSELRTFYPGKRLVVGVAITSTFISKSENASGLPGTAQKKLLLLQRTAKEDDFPMVYEIPGGTADDDVDTTILDTVVREAFEETGLIVRSVLKEFECFEYETRKGKSLQLNFLVGVEEGEGELQVKINPAEHDTFVWVAGEEDLKSLQISPGMVQVVKNAFKIM